jgi:hypothetical protein
MGGPDPLVSPFVMAEYYDTVLEFMGEGTTKSFYKLYMIRGLYHCSLGLGSSNDDGLFDALVDWVEEGIPGAQLFSYDSILGHLGCALDLQKAGKAITDFLK